MNVQFDYRYRDWGNFKRNGSVVFGNRSRLDIEEIGQRITGALVDGEFFDASSLQIPELFFPDFPFDPDLDHGWHEFCGVSETHSPVDDLSGRDVAELLPPIKSRVHHP